MTAFPSTSTLAHSKASPFTPEHPVDGYRGFYPCPADWSATMALPLPLRCLTVRDVKAVHCKVMFHAAENGGVGTGKPVFHSFHAVLTPAEAIKMLFTSAHVTLDHLQVEWVDGGITFASWRQDTRTGAFAIFAGCYNESNPCIVQGGYLGHMPANVQWLDESYGKPWNAWALTSAMPGCSSW
jgi:hypothetical protein